MKKLKSFFTIRYLIPICLITVMGYIFAQGLKNDPHELPSALVDKPFPTLELNNVFSNNMESLNQVMKDKVILLNIWATWCKTCQTEMPALKQLSKETNVNLYSIAYKDSRSRVLSWLTKFGNPF